MMPPSMTWRLNLTVGMVIPDDYPLGTYIVNGTAKDAAGNATPVTLKLIVTGDRVAPALTITGARDGSTPLAGTLAWRVHAAHFNVPANNHELHFAAGSISSEPLDGKSRPVPRPDRHGYPRPDRLLHGTHPGRLSS